MDVQFIIKSFLQSKKKSNVILELETSLLSDDESCILSSINAVQNLFVQIFSRNMLMEVEGQDNIQVKYRLWLLSRYNDFTTHMLNYLSHNSKDIQKAALHTLVKFVQLESKHPLKIVPSGAWYFPKALFEIIVCVMASQDIDQRYLITEFKQFTIFDDVKMYLLKSILHLFEKADKVTDVFLQNCFLILCTLKMPNFSEQKEILNTLSFQEGVETPFHLKKKLYIKLFSTVWVQFLHFQLPPLLINKVLIILHKKVIPYLQNPCLMTDFLTDSYNKGGITSLLALNGLFLLMQKYNVEYPDFFLKLYALFDESIVNGKFSAKFFYLSDIFLSSTHLPAYIVAAFIKKLSRISLNSKTDSILKIIPFVCNILIRHPALKELIHRKDPKDLEKDPYDFHAADPAESRAMESSLWEIKTLQSHVNPVVARKAKIINSELPKLEFNLSKLLTVSMSDLYENERKRKFSDAPLAISKASKDDWWILSNSCIL